MEDFCLLELEVLFEEDQAFLYFVEHVDQLLGLFHQLGVLQDPLALLIVLVALHLGLYLPNYLG